METMTILDTLSFGFFVSVAATFGYRIMDKLMDVASDLLAKK